MSHSGDKRKQPHEPSLPAEEPAPKRLQSAAAVVGLLEAAEQVRGERCRVEAGVGDASVVRTLALMFGGVVVMLLCRETRRVCRRRWRGACG